MLCISKDIRVYADGLCTNCKLHCGIMFSSYITGILTHYIYKYSSRIYMNGSKEISQEETRILGQSKDNWYLRFSW